MAGDVVAVAAKRRKKEQGAAWPGHWGWSAGAGMVLCAFFVLGVMTGLEPARPHARGASSQALLDYWTAVTATFAR